MGKIIEFKKGTVLGEGENKKKKSIRKIIKKSIIFIGIILAGVFAAMQIYDWYNTHRKIDVVLQDNIKLSYISRNDERFNNFYPLFEDYIGSDEEYLFTENCATQLMITNHYNNQVVIDKIILDADEIKVDYSPVLTFRDGNEFEDGLSISIVNSGWGVAKDLKIKLVGTTINLEEYFKKEALEFVVPLVDSSEEVEVPFLKNSDLLGHFADGTCLGIDFEVECECEGTPIVYSEVGVFIYDGKLVFGWAGDYAQNIYGIKIDTAEDNFLWEESISEFVDQGETLVLPICFFPDKSCSLKMEISFEIVNDGKKEVISTGLNEMYFSVSSISEWNGIITYSIDDMKTMSEDDKQFMRDDENFIISYPENPAIKIQ